MKTLENYLKENCQRLVIDHAMRAEVAADGTVSFYLHPHGVDGDTLDFVVNGNQLLAKYAVDDFKAAAADTPALPPDVLALMEADRAKAQSAPSTDSHCMMCDGWGFISQGACGEEISKCLECNGEPTRS